MFGVFDDDVGVVFVVVVVARRSVDSHTVCRRRHAGK